MSNSPEGGEDYRTKMLHTRTSPASLHASSQQNPIQSGQFNNKKISYELWNKLINKFLQNYSTDLAEP